MKKNKNNSAESGNAIQDSRGVNIMHMDAKPFVIAFLIWGIVMFLFFAFLAGLGAYAIHNLDQKIEAATLVDNK